MVPKNSTATLISTTVADDTVCLEFWYSLPSTKSNLKVDMETTWGHSESIWKKTSTANKGGWMKRSLIINYMYNYKASYIRSVFSLIFDTLKKNFLTGVI